jgi:hypothetical protein
VFFVLGDSHSKYIILSDSAATKNLLYAWKMFSSAHIRKVFDTMTVNKQPESDKMMYLEWLSSSLSGNIKLA